VLAPTGTTGPLFPDWDWAKFSRDVWVPAKAEMAARHEPTRGLRKRPPEPKLKRLC